MRAVFVKKEQAKAFGVKLFLYSTGILIEASAVLVISGIAVLLMLLVRSLAK